MLGVWPTARRSPSGRWSRSAPTASMSTTPARPAWWRKAERVALLHGGLYELQDQMHRGSQGAQQRGLACHRAHDGAGGSLVRPHKRVVPSPDATYPNSILHIESISSHQRG